MSEKNPPSPRCFRHSPSPSPSPSTSTSPLPRPPPLPVPPARWLTERSRSCTESSKCTRRCGAHPPLPPRYPNPPSPTPRYPNPPSLPGRGGVPAARWTYLAPKGSADHSCPFERERERERERESFSRERGLAIPSLCCHCAEGERRGGRPHERGQQRGRRPRLVRARRWERHRRRGGLSGHLSHSAAPRPGGRGGVGGLVSH